MDGKLLSTPVEVYPIIAGYAYGKTFCDLGCGTGSVLNAMKGIANKIIQNSLCNHKLFAAYNICFRNDILLDEFSIGVFNHVR